MKKILIKIGIAFVFLLFVSNNSYCQLVFEREVDTLDLDIQFKIVNISDNESKYFIADTVNNTFNLLNMDFSPFMLNIAVPEPFNDANYSFQVVYISRTLFDCDSTNIEFVYTAPIDFNKPFRVVRTDGTVLFFKDSINATYCYGCHSGQDEIRPIMNTSDGTKLFLQTFKNGYSQVFIYDLCGSLPISLTTPNLILEPEPLKVYPNPSSNILNFELNSNINIGNKNFEILLFDQNAKLKNVFSFNNENIFKLDISNFLAGTYSYKIILDNHTFKIGKFIVNH